jgi:hypothetical protein
MQNFIAGFIVSGASDGHHCWGVTSSDKWSGSGWGGWFVLGLLQQLQCWGSICGVGVSGVGVGDCWLQVIHIIK